MVEQVLSIMKSERCPPVVRVRPTKFRYLRFVEVFDTVLNQATENQNSSLMENNDINNPHRINLPSPRPQWSLFSFSLIHIFATGSAVMTDLFSGDGLFAPFLKRTCKLIQES